MQKGAISLLDVLGWKGIWQRKTDAISTLRNLISASQVWINSYKEDSIMSKHFSDLKVEIRSISDTIALVTHGEYYRSIEFHGIINRFLVSNSIIRKIPLRGATAYGEFQITDNIMIGPAVDEVASWYEQSDWIGVFLTPSAGFKFDESKFFSSKLNFDFLNNIYLEHDVKIKGIGNYTTHCVDWPSEWNDGKDELIDHFLKMGPITPLIASKYINTLSFYDKSKAQKFSG